MDLTKNGSAIFASLFINNELSSNDILANPISVSQLPTTISVSFLKVCESNFSTSSKISLRLLEHNSSKCDNTQSSGIENHINQCSN